MRPVRNRQRLDAVVGSREVFVKAAKKPAADVLGATHDASVDAAADLGAAPGAAATIATTAQWFHYSRLSRPERRFHAPVGLGALVNYSAAADASCYDPVRAALGRVVSYFYLPPPQAGAPGDGLPVIFPQAGAVLPAGGGIRTERKFAVLRPLLGAVPSRCKPPWRPRSALARYPAPCAARASSRARPGHSESVAPPGRPAASGQGPLRRARISCRLASAPRL